VKNRRAIYAGTFDPITNGHMDIIQRACTIFDEVVIAVADSSSKKPLFDLDLRVKMVEKSVARFAEARVISFNSLLVDLCRELSINILVRGLRGVGDFEYELNMGYANSSLNSEVETIYLMSNLESQFVSSSLVRSLLPFKGRISHLVPNEILEDIERGYSVYTI